VKRVFLDSGGFFANLVPEDASHQRAARLFREAQDAGWELVTTNAVVFETHALLVNRVRDGRTVALRFLESVEAGLCRVERVTRGDEASALRLLRAQTDKDYSFCDALSFAVMERLGIKEAIAFDRDFSDYGRFTIL